MTPRLMTTVPTRPVETFESTKGKLNDKEKANRFRISPLEFLDERSTPENPTTGINTLGQQNELGIPKVTVTPRNNTSAERLRNKTFLEGTKPNLDVSEMDPLPRNMNISKRSMRKNGPPGPDSISDLKSTKGYRNIEEQEMHMPLASQRPLVDTRIPRIGNRGLKTNQNWKKTLSPENQLTPSQDSPTGRNEHPPQPAEQ